MSKPRRLHRLCVAHERGRAPGAYLKPSPRCEECRRRYPDMQPQPGRTVSNFMADGEFKRLPKR